MRVCVCVCVCVYLGFIDYAHSNIAPYWLYNFLFYFFYKIASRLNTDLQRQLLQEKVCGTKHEFVRARLCFSYFFYPSLHWINFICIPFHVHGPSWLAGWCLSAETGNKRFKTAIPVGASTSQPNLHLCASALEDAILVYFLFFFRRFLIIHTSALTRIA